MLDCWRPTVVALVTINTKSNEKLLIIITMYYYHVEAAYNNNNLTLTSQQVNAVSFDFQNRTNPG